jgi:EAL domain-containing protein (putative c-di-GMP-specific phosphodiesterase class I)
VSSTICGYAGCAGEVDPTLNLLLVSSSAEWAQAIKSAISDVSAGLLTCGPSEALARLAGIAAHYTHLLVQESDADGLSGTLAAMATEIVDPDTNVLMLGRGSDASTQHIRAITAADPRAVQEALMASRPRGRAEQGVEIADLHAALKAGAIELRYQPIIRMSDRHPVGLEALARLRHPTLGIVLPDLFVPQVESEGLAAQFTDLVAARVFADLVSPSLSGTGMRIAVNFPLDVLLSPTSIARLEQRRAARGVPADRIVIELTESQPVRDLVTLRRSVEQLRTLGYGVAIDDVGPAVQHLDPLLDLPFTSLKLDKTLVTLADSSPDVLRYLADTVRDAKRHDLSVVAEGVETEAIWTHMQTIGVDHVQGYIAARPLPRNAVPIWLKTWAANPN